MLVGQTKADINVASVLEILNWSGYWKNTAEISDNMGKQ